MRMIIDFYEDKKGGHGLKLTNGGDCDKDFINFLKVIGLIPSQRIDKNLNFFWLDRKNIYEQFNNLFIAFKSYKKSKELKKIF